MTTERERSIDTPRAIARLASRVREEPLYRALADVASERRDSVHVVGGTVRDALLGRDWHDLDVAMAAERAAPLAAALAASIGATLVPLDDRLPTYRVVLGDAAARTEVDVSGFRGADIVEDLRARDLTINALGVSLASLAEGTTDGSILDPTGGLDDLERRVARVPTEAVLAADPLRVLRVHRFAATLGLTIEPATRAAVRAHAASLASVATERIAAELLQLLAAPRGGAALAELWLDGLLAVIFREVATMAGVTQNTFHHLDVLEHTLAACREADEIRASPERFYGETAAPIAAYLESEDHGAMVVLATLLHDVAKPATRFVDESGVHFHRHEALGAEMTATIARRLHLSTKRRECLTAWVAQHLGLKDLIMLHREDRLTERTMRRFLRRSGDDLPGLLCVVLADTRATRGPDFPKDGEVLLLEVSRRLLELDAVQRSDAANALPLVRGRDLIERFGLAPGPEMGRLLAEVEEARIDGEVHDREDALAWIAARVGPED